MHQVFLSSTAKDLAAFREAADATISGLDGFHCVRMEDFGVRDAQADDFCQARIAECQLAVFLVGLCYGSSPPGSDRSYTEREYQAAEAVGVPRLVFLSDEDSFYPGYYREPDALWERQQAFRQQLGEELPRGSFSTPGELGAQVAQALANWAKQVPDPAAAGSQVTVSGSGAAATGSEGVAVGGGVQSLVIARDGGTVIMGNADIPMTQVDRDSARGRYLLHLTSRNRYLQLQGIRSGGKLVHIELDRIYIRLRATQQRVRAAEERWLEGEAKRAPGERLSAEAGPATETVTVNVEQALAEHRRLVVLGDPGSGKTTLLRYLTLPYARDLAEGSHLVEQKLHLAESGHLPIFLPLRQIGAFLKAAPDDGTEGHARLLAFLFRSLEEERIRLPRDFFDAWLTQGRAVILLDGLDEVADPDLRRRVACLVEGFVQAYPECRYLVTSRIIGYAGAARLGESFVTTTVRDFSLADVEQCLSNWHRLVAVGLMGSGPSAEAYAAEQTRQLMQAVRGNERIRELAINPLMLTVIAMVHRDRVQALRPPRRAVC